MPENNNQVSVSLNSNRHQFEAHVSGETGLLQYRLEGNSIVFTHTEVPPPIEGRGVAAALARAGLDYARTENLVVIPLCPFVSQYLRRHPEYAALIDGRYRAKLFPEHAQS